MIVHPDMYARVVDDEGNCTYLLNLDKALEVLAADPDAGDTRVAGLIRWLQAARALAAEWAP